MLHRLASPLLAAALFLGMGVGKANAAFVTFFDKSAFLAATGATQATLPYIVNGSTKIISGSVTLSSAPGAGNIWPSPDWTYLLPGVDLAVSYNENIDVKVENPVFALGFDFVEPEKGPNVQGVFVDSTFSIRLLNEMTEVASFTFNAANDIAYFVGVQSDVAFSKMEIREIVGGYEEEFFGHFYSSAQAAPSNVPEPASLALLGLGLTGLTVATRRRRT